MVLKVYAGSKLITVTDLDIEFNIKATRGADPNTGLFTIFNLEKDLISLIESAHQGVEFLVSPNPVDEPTLIFRGTSTNVVHDPSGLDDILTIIAGEGAKEFTKAYVNKTYAKGTTLNEILDDLAAALGLPMNAGSFGPETALNYPLMLSGRAGNCLSQVARDFDLSWSIQRGTIEVLEKYGLSTLAPNAVKLTFDTGLIETPVLIDVEDVEELFGKKRKAEEDPKGGPVKKLDETRTIGVRFKSLFNPALVPGRIVEIADSPTLVDMDGMESRRLLDLNVNGLYRCDTIQTSGSTTPRKVEQEGEARRTDGRRA
jgi:hypothetical protein